MTHPTPVLPVTPVQPRGDRGWKKIQLEPAGWWRTPVGKIKWWSIKIKFSSGPGPFYPLPILSPPESYIWYEYRQGHVQFPVPSGLYLGIEEDRYWEGIRMWLHTSISHSSGHDVRFKGLVLLKKKRCGSLAFEIRVYNFMHALWWAPLSCQEQGSFHCKSWGCETEASWKIP